MAALSLSPGYFVDGNGPYEMIFYRKEFQSWRERVEECDSLGYPRVVLHMSYGVALRVVHIRCAVCSIRPSTR